MCQILCPRGLWLRRNLTAGCGSGASDGLCAGSSAMKTRFRVQNGSNNVCNRNILGYLRILGKAWTQWSQKIGIWSQILTKLAELWFQTRRGPLWSWGWGRSDGAGVLWADQEGEGLWGAAGIDENNTQWESSCKFRSQPDAEKRWLKVQNNDWRSMKQ